MPEMRPAMFRTLQNVLSPLNISSPQELAKKVEMDYIETSAKENVNVNETFLSLIRGLVKAGQEGKDSNSPGVIQITSTQSRRSKKEGCCSKS